MKNRFLILLALTVLLSSPICWMLVSHSGVTSAVADSKPPNEFLANFTEALQVIQQTYVEEVGSNKLVYSAIRRMLHRLDPHSNFLDPKDFAKLREDQHSVYYGLGIQLHALLVNRGRHVIVDHPIAGTPAERKGLRLGDVITHIGGEPIDNWTTDEVVNHLKGPRGTSVDIVLERPGVRNPLHVTIERDEIPLTTIPYAFELKPGIGYVKIEKFSENTAEELNSGLDRLKGLSGLILDLRDNPGGLLNQAIEISDFFLHRGALIVSTKGRLESSTKSYKVLREGKIQIPVVVLINHQTASASEIVAGALQDHDRALIVGERSFGKGLVQTVYTLEDNTGMTLTTAKYYTPSGRLIQRDYSGSSLEYYFLNSDDAPAKNNDAREVRFTDAKREVYGGGGITPDIVEPARKANRFEAMLASKDVFFQFGRRLLLNDAPDAGISRSEDKNREKSLRPEKNSESLPGIEVTDAILSDFRQFLHDRNIDFSEQEIETNLDFIKRRIKQDTCITSFGIKEAFKIGIQADPQVMKALEAMPQAKALMMSGRASPLAQIPTRQEQRP